jgi:hypothetical protein
VGWVPNNVDGGGGGRLGGAGGGRGGAYNNGTVGVGGGGIGDPGLDFLCYLILFYLIF